MIHFTKDNIKQALITAKLRDAAFLIAFPVYLQFFVERAPHTEQLLPRRRTKVRIKSIMFFCRAVRQKRSSAWFIGACRSILIQ